jgi:hypothetical protein
MINPNTKRAVENTNDDKTIKQCSVLLTVVKVHDLSIPVHLYRNNLISF